jgi:hypothetical protein
MPQQFYTIIQTGHSVSIQTADCWLDALKLAHDTDYPTDEPGNICYYDFNIITPRLVFRPFINCQPSTLVAGVTPATLRLNLTT